MSEDMTEAQGEKPAPRKPAKKAPTFDPEKPHATVHGAATKARYLQGGQYFGADGTPCEL
jgi:hypothetical protein